MNAVKVLVRKSKIVGTPYEVGKRGEDYISKTRRLTKNKEVYQQTLSSKARIPDFIDKNRGILIESKNVAKQSMTQQLKDFVGIAKANNWQMEMYVRQGTILSKNIDPFIKIKYFPW